ncbi:MAG: hypothetical protein JXX14_19985 [Deltaproteobacteria bacterium]|nr:hypothetical protein [Deltaproteobacteria bacterium]
MINLIKLLMILSLGSVLLLSNGCGNTDAGDVTSNSDSDSDSDTDGDTDSDADADSDSDSDTDSDSDSDSDADMPVSCDSLEMDGETVVVTLLDEQNYSFSNEIEFESTTVGSRADITFIWEDLTTDMVEQPVNPSEDIGLILVSMWDHPEEETVAIMNSDTWTMKDMLTPPGIFEVTNGETRINYLSLVSMGGSPLEEEGLLNLIDASMYSPDDFSYSIMVSTGTTPGKNARMIAYFNIDPESDNHEVIVHNKSAELDYTVDLSNLQKISIPAQTADVFVDWSLDVGPLYNSMGKDFIPTDITEAMVAHYAELSPADLKADFLNLENLAEGNIWRKTIQMGTYVNLSELTNEDGDPFTGIDSTGTWIIALTCGRCAIPAPWFLSIFSTCEE